MTTTNKGLNTPANGSNVNTWDVPVNANFTTIDTAFGGSVTVSGLTGGTTTFTSAQYTPPIVILTGTLTSNQTLNFPSGVGGIWSIYNNTTGSYTVTIGSGGGGSTVSITQGYRTAVVCDGTNVAPATTTPTAVTFLTGMIMLWSGSIGTIPTGWVICNGSNGTPDLRDRFVIGAGNTYSPGNSSGSTLATSVTVNGHVLDVSEIPSHNHTFTTNPSYTGISASDSGHSHTISWPSTTYIGQPGAGSALAGGNNVTAYGPPGGTNTGFANISIADPSHTHNGTTDSTGGGGAHSHTATATTTGLPPYYALAYIMKT